MVADAGVCTLQAAEIWFPGSDLVTCSGDAQTEDRLA